MQEGFNLVIKLSSSSLHEILVVSLYKGFLNIA